MPINLRDADNNAAAAGAGSSLAIAFNNLQNDSTSADAQTAARVTIAALRNAGAIPNYPVKGNDIFFLGDSITAYGVASSTGNNTGTMYTPLLCAQSWPGLAMGISQGRLRYAGQGATGGFTSAQIKAAHLAAAVAAAASFTCIMCGRNDIRGDVPVATTMQNIIDMCTAVVAVGSTPILCSTAAQSENSAAWNVTRYALNAAIKAYADSKRYPFVDFDKVTAGPDGQWKPGYNLDVSHPSVVGANAMAHALVRTMYRMPSIMPIRPKDATGNSNLVTNGKFNGLTGWTTTSGAPAIQNGIASLTAAGLTQTVTTVSGTRYTVNFSMRARGLSPNVLAYVAQGATLVGGIREWYLQTESRMYFSFEFVSMGTSTTITLGASAGTLEVSEFGIYPLTSQ